MLERTLIVGLLAGGLLTGLSHVSEMINQRFNAAECAIKSYDGCIQPAAPERKTSSQARYFSVDPS